MLEHRALIPYAAIYSAYGELIEIRCKALNKYGIFSDFVLNTQCGMVSNRFFHREANLFDYLFLGDFYGTKFYIDSERKDIEIDTDAQIRMSVMVRKLDNTYEYLYNSGIAFIPWTHESFIPENATEALNFYIMSNGDVVTCSQSELERTEEETHWLSSYDKISFVIPSHLLKERITTLIIMGIDVKDADEFPYVEWPSTEETTIIASNMPWLAYTPNSSDAKSVIFGPENNMPISALLTTEKKVIFPKVCNSDLHIVLRDFDGSITLPEKMTSLLIAGISQCSFNATAVIKADAIAVNAESLAAMQNTKLVAKKVLRVMISDSDMHFDNLNCQTDLLFLDGFSRDNSGLKGHLNARRCVVHYRLQGLFGHIAAMSGPALFSLENEDNNTFDRVDISMQLLPDRNIDGSAVLELRNIKAKTVYIFAINTNVGAMRTTSWVNPDLPPVNQSEMTIDELAAYSKFYVMTTNVDPALEAYCKKKLVLRLSTVNCAIDRLVVRTVCSSVCFANNIDKHKITLYRDSNTKPSKLK